MLILGIESSCDETAASVAEDYTKIRSNVVASQVKEASVIWRCCAGNRLSATLWRRPACSTKGVGRCTGYTCRFRRHCGYICSGFDWGVAGLWSTCQGLALGDRKPVRSRTSLSRTHCSELYCPSGTETAVSLLGGKWRTQPYCRSFVLYRIPNCWQESRTMQLVNVLIKQPVRWDFRIRAAFTLTTLHRREIQRHFTCHVRKWREIPMISAFPA